MVCLKEKYAKKNKKQKKKKKKNQNALYMIASVYSRRCRSYRMYLGDVELYDFLYIPFSAIFSHSPRPLSTSPLSSPPKTILSHSKLHS